MPEKKLVSVCINTYNSEKTIEKTLSSVINQTYKNLQIIVVDDCSTDGTVDIIKGFDDKRIELTVLDENKGVSGSNNECLIRAKGDYIAHLDADDVWVPEKTEIQLDFMEKNPEYGACFSHAGMIDENYNIYPDHSADFVDVYNIPNMSQSEFIRFFDTSLNHLCHCSIFIRKYVQSEIGLHDLTMCYLHDFDMWTRLAIEYPIYIIQEKLVYCMKRSDSNSALNHDSYIAHNEECARILYNMIYNCPDKLFLEAYKDKLILKKPTHTHEETELEKAFVLMDAFWPYRTNPCLGLKKFDELFADPIYIDIAKKSFGMTPKDLISFHTSPVFYDHNDVLISENKDRRIKELEKAYADLSYKYNVFYSSKEARLVRPLTNLRNKMFEKKKYSSSLLKNGAPAKAKFMLYGYYRHNLGDDMFFDYLFKRYPDTLFVVSFTPDYAEFLNRYENVKFFDETAPAVVEANRKGAAKNVLNLFEQTQIKNSDGVVHIGGSIFQQIADWEMDLKFRKEHQDAAKNFFSLSNNFGPYKTEDYKNFWHDSFKGFTDICFRDKYSYELFSDLGTVRYAPDIIFNLGGKVSAEKPFDLKKDSVFVSVIDPYLEVRNFSAETCSAYEMSITGFVKFCAKNRRNVYLTSFCEYENDGAFVDKIMGKLNRLEKLFVHPLKYMENIDEISDAIADSKYVLSTRFHAMILGLIYGCKVLPICYSGKMTNVIKDMNLFNEYGYINITNMDSLSPEELMEKLQSSEYLSDERIKEIAEASAGQFAELDRFIAGKGGTVNK